MSDAVVHPLDAFNGTATSSLGPATFNVSSRGNYVFAATGTTTFTLAGNGVWEDYQDTLNGKSPTMNDTILGFPHIVYPDVLGDYDRNSQTWSNTGGYYVGGQWYGATNGGPVTLFDMIHYMTTTPYDQQYPQVVQNWESNTIPIYLDPTGQPYYGPPDFYGDRHLIPNGSTIPANSMSGTDILWQMLQSSPTTGGSAFTRLDHDPRTTGEPGIYFQFNNNPQALGWMGESGVTTTGYRIVNAVTNIIPIIVDSFSLTAAGSHELPGRDAGCGSNTNSSPFASDNMAASGNTYDSARDFDCKHFPVAASQVKIVDLAKLPNAR
jgi:hypothetical protein